ncbi:hypothetical protein LINGRAHAP2_LOCUS14526 [Linum grandiflorum]
MVQMRKRKEAKKVRNFVGGRIANDMLGDLEFLQRA